MTATAPIEFYDAPSATEEPVASPSTPSALSEAVAELDEALEGLDEPELPVERERTLRAPGFTRMPVSWHGDHAPMIRTINVMAEEWVRQEFDDLFALKEEIERAACPIDLSTGEKGRPDYAAIPETRKQHWVLELSIKLVDWEQKAAALWGEAMMAKVIRQEVFTDAYLNAVKGRTVEDRTQSGQNASLQDYYFAVLCALRHKHAVAACSGAERLCQRLKDFCAR